ncbi:LysR family transcriptional regulator [Rhizobium jaguaris]|uniref:HTH-type transcriptional regulator TtuA n=1 Tax=Rhizobium jaguaris TaxID=1312183 RepID=A0A387G242_9HYPH|nr:LysR family transcriptional regulator [Rhizobium jaguaris]
MELRAFRYLKAVVETGSFAAAAARPGMNSSNLTRQISSLEDELGLSLLERSRAGIRLTSAGAAVMVEVRRMLSFLRGIWRLSRSCDCASDPRTDLRGPATRPPSCHARDHLLARQTGPREPKSNHRAEDVHTGTAVTGTKFELRWSRLHGP